MNVEEALQGVSALLMDSAPVIYHFEKNPRYAPLMERFFAVRSRRGVVLVTSPVTLAECLVHPIRLGNAALAALYSRLIVRGENTRFHVLGEAEGNVAARLRAEHGGACPFMRAENHVFGPRTRVRRGPRAG